MKSQTRDRFVYRSAIIFIKKKLVDNNCNPEILEKYLTPDQKTSLPDYYLTLLISGASRERSQGVIDRPVGGVNRLRKVLYNFNVKKIAEISDPSIILEKIVDSFNLNINVGKRGLWYQYCETILSGAKFLCKFKDHNDFTNFVNFFHNDVRARNALPLLLKQEIKGFGFALACDFLKESGFHWYAKPDVHLIEIFSQLNISETKNDYEVLNSIVRMAENNGKTPFAIDKIFWLIGSGKFYKDNHPETKKPLFIGRNRNDFIKFVKDSIKNI
jgi:hypothetical protein